MSSEERKNRIIWGILLLIGALGSASMRNNPVLGIMPFAVGVIEALIYICILCAVRFCGWRMAAVIAVLTPIYLWAQRFLDGYMIPVEVATNLVLIGCMCLCGRVKWNFVWKTLMLALPACAVMILGGAAALWAVKHENIIRAVIVSWNTDLYPCLSVLIAAAGSLLLTGESICKADK